MNTSRTLSLSQMRRLNKFFAVFLFSVIISQFSFAAKRRGQDLVPSGHWVYDALSQIEIDVGRWNFFDQTPLTIQNIQQMLSEIPYERLSESAKIQYKRIEDYFSESDISLDLGLFSVGFEPGLNVEGYYKTNDELPWLYNYHDRQRLLEAPLRVGVGEYLTLFMGVAVGQRRSYMDKDFNPVNHVFIEDAFDPNLTHSTYLSTGYTWENGVGVNLNFGIGKKNFGRAALGSIMQSDYLSDVPYGQFRLYSPIFSYTFDIQQLNPKETLYLHSLDFRFFKKFMIGAIEGGAAYNTFDMKFINPLGIFHAYELNNYYDWISYFGFKIDFVPVKNVRIYALTATTEHQMLTEQTSGSRALPEGQGVQGGFDFQLPVARGFLKFNIEGYYATPYLWIKQSPNWSLVSATGDESSPSYQWIGSPVGPDSIAGKFSAGYERPGVWAFNVNYIFAARGEFSSDSIFTKYKWYAGNTDGSFERKWIYPDANGYKYGRAFSTPHGTPEYDNIIYARAEWFPKDWLKLIAQPAYIFVFNSGHKDGNFEQGFEIALSARIEFCKLYKKRADLGFLFRDKLDKEQEKE